MASPTDKHSGLELAPWIDTLSEVDTHGAHPRHEPPDEDGRAHKVRGGRARRTICTVDAIMKGLEGASTLFNGLYKLPSHCICSANVPGPEVDRA